MGYHTDFEGRVAVFPPLNAAEVAYLTRFNQSRRWDRPEGPYGTDDTRAYTREMNSRYGQPPAGQPELWCPWVPTPDGTALVWDGCEKPYEGEEWMRYLVDHFLKPDARVSVHLRNIARQSDDYRTTPPMWHMPEEFGGFTFNHVCTGGFHAEGEERDDNWTLIVEGNQVRRVEEHVELPDPDQVVWTAERVDGPDVGAPSDCKRVIQGSVVRGEIEG